MGTERASGRIVQPSRHQVVIVLRGVVGSDQAVKGGGMRDTSVLMGAKLLGLVILAVVLFFVVLPFFL